MDSSERISNKIYLSDFLKMLSNKSADDKIRFVEYLLFEITIMNRAIWSDNEYSDSVKVEILKWSNELTHRIWNLSFDLKRNKAIDFENKLAEHIDFYRKQSSEFSGHLAATFTGAINKFDRLINE